MATTIIAFMRTLYMAAIMNLSKQSFAPVPLSSFFETGCGMCAHWSKPKSNRNPLRSSRPIESRLAAAPPQCSYRGTLDLCMKHAKWVLDAKCYRSLGLVNQATAQRPCWAHLAALIRAAQLSLVGKAPAGHLRRVPVIAMGALVGRSWWFRLGKNQLKVGLNGAKPCDQACRHSGIAVSQER